MLEIDLATPALARLVSREAPLDRLYHGLTFGEGPLWSHRDGTFRWVDIVGDTIYRFKPGVGTEVLIRPSTKANGLTFDRQGRLCVAGWASRSVWRVEPDGSTITLASHWEGKRINSPNDIVVRSDGSIYFTDSPGALSNVGMAGEDVQQYLDFQGVFRISPDGARLDAVITDTVYPNGLAFTPDESILYVNDTRLGEIRAYDIRPDGSCGPPRLFHKLTGSEPGIADGMKVDREGTVYCTGPGGIHVIGSDGSRLGRIRIADHCTNMAWGDADWRSLFITTYHSVFRTRVNVPGVPVW
jgi:gluconolactonase